MESWYQPFKEFWQHLKAMFTAGAGKLGIESSVAENSAAAMVGTTSGTMGGVVFYGAFGVLSAITNQIEYGAARGRIADFYHDELAAKLKKPKEKVVDDDIDILAKGDAAKGIPANHTIAHEIAHEKKIRNLGIGASFVASIAVVTLMHALMAAIAVAVAPAAGAGALSLGVAGTLAKGALGLLAYLSIKRPLMEVGKTLLGLNETTTHDLILGIAKDREHGKAISREQVIEVFLSANKQLSNYVEQRYGAEYEHLPLAEKVRMSAELAEILPADKIAHNINLGVANASELAFTAQGDISGVLPKAAGTKIADETKKTFLGRIGHHCRNVVKAINHTLHPEKAHAIPELSAINRAQKEFETGPPSQSNSEESPIVEFNNNTPSFVDRLGRAPRDADKAHAERHAERSAQNVMMPGSATIQ